jgi:hypothetical protein
MASLLCTGGDDFPYRAAPLGSTLGTAAFPRGNTQKGVYSAVRLRFWMALILGGLSAALALLTLITREWIEIIFGFDPDGGSGALEWAIVIGLAVLAIVSLGYARIEWRRTRSAT